MRDPRVSSAFILGLFDTGLAAVRSLGRAGISVIGPDAWIRTLQYCVDKAIETGTVLHLWFHPSCEQVNVEQVFPTVLETIAYYRKGLKVATMGDLVNYLRISLY